jgi:hypothetical protein
MKRLVDKMASFNPFNPFNPFVLGKIERRFFQLQAIWEDVVQLCRFQIDKIRQR